MQGEPIGLCAAAYIPLEMAAQASPRAWLGEELFRDPSALGKPRLRNAQPPNWCLGFGQVPRLTVYRSHGCNGNLLVYVPRLTFRWKWQLKLRHAHGSVRSSSEIRLLWASRVFGIHNTQIGAWDLDSTTVDGLPFA